MSTVLAIETSCDETSVAIVTGGHQVRCNLIATQFDLHRKYGGVVPELASRSHLETLDLLVRDALAETDLLPNDIDAVAVTRGPGLIGSLLVGVTAAKTLAWAWGLPLIGVNHIHAHATSAAIELGYDPWPAVALVVSGGHTSLFHVTDYADIRLLGSTRDDAAGEAFDKVAMLLGLGFPGGPVIDRLSRGADENAVSLPRARLEPGSLDFSFSGLKTAVMYHIHGPGRTSGGLERMSPEQISNLCASFSKAVVDVLVEKALDAARQVGARTVVVGGGVAANSILRRELTSHCESAGLALHLTPLRLCTDNAAMIAALACRLFAVGRRDDLGLTAAASLARA